MNLIKKTLLMCIITTPLFSIAEEKQTTISLKVINKTDQDHIIAARYQVLPSQQPGLASMPNPFMFIDVPAHETTYAHFNRKGSQRLGDLDEIVVRSREHELFKQFNKDILNNTKDADPLLVTIE